MTKPAIALLLMVMNCTAQVPAGPKVAGQWKVYSSLFPESDSTCTFTQTGNNLSGTCESDDGESKVTGAVDGNTVSWSFKTEMDESAVTVTYSGSVDAEGKMSGTTSVTEMNAKGQFTAVKSNTQ